MRSCSSPVLVQEAAEQVASTYPAVLICHADGGQTHAWVRRTACSPAPPAGPSSASSSSPMASWAVPSEP